MKLGAPFLGAFQIENPLFIRDYVQAVEDMGFTHLFADEILLNQDPTQVYHETLTLFSYIAAVTKQIRLVTGIMVLPKRQTLLVARQAAEVDVLSGGRLRLGVGVGWNQSEFEALGVDFHTRGRRIEEQIKILKALWTRERIDFSGSFHQISNFGINLLPRQRPIPIWIGGTAEVVLRRAARLADGWIADESVADNIEQIILKLKGYVEEENRDPANFKIVKYLPESRIPRSMWGGRIQTWKQMGVTHTVLLPESGSMENTDINDLLEPLRFLLEETNASPEN